MEYLIELKKVCLQFDLGFAIENLTFGVKEKEIFGFLGPSGAGKTTTIKLLTKQLKRKSGSISLLGKDIDQVTRSDYDQIGILSDTSNLYERMSIQDNLNFFAGLRGIGRGQVEDILQRVGLKEQRKQVFKKCSRGMKQRAILASAVLHRPRLLFLDEPTSGLDPATSQEIHRLLLQLNKTGTTIFLTTHNMEEADKLCHRVGIINQGKLIACGAPRDLKLQFARDEIRVMKRDRQYITVKKDEAGAKRIAELIQAGDGVTIHSNEPNLEEIFLQLTGREF